MIESSVGNAYCRRSPVDMNIRMKLKLLISNWIFIYSYSCLLYKARIYTMNAFSLGYLTARGLTLSRTDQDSCNGLVTIGNRISCNTSANIARIANRDIRHVDCNVDYSEPAKCFCVEMKPPPVVDMWIHHATNPGASGSMQDYKPSCSSYITFGGDAGWDSRSSLLCRRA